MLDIHKIGYIYFSIGTEKINKINRGYERWSSNSYFLGVLNFLFRYLHSIFFNGHHFVEPPYNYNGCLFYGVSVNNVRSLTPIINKLSTDDVPLKIFSVNDYPEWKIYHYAIPHFLDLIKVIIHSSKEDRLVIRSKFPIFWRMYGNEKFVNEMLDKYKPKLVVFANDHNDLPRTINYVAKKRGIKTLYVQHASIGDKFPPLNFTYAFLDGKETYEKYKKVGTKEGDIYLCGGVRFDSVIPCNENNNPNIIRMGIAINILDQENKVKDFIKFFIINSCASKKLIITLRPHPTLNLTQWESWCNKENIYFSSPFKESSFEFLSKQDYLISNESSIHLDAAMSHIKSLIFNFSNSEFEDVYGYSKRNLSLYVAFKEDILGYIMKEKDFPDNRKAINYYCASYGSIFEGNVSYILARMIHLILNGNVSSFNDEFHLHLLNNEGSMRVYGWNN